MSRQILTSEILPSLVGKTISWAAPIYKGNHGHWGNGLAGGIAKVTAVNINKRRPITAEIIEGDEIQYAFTDKPWTEDYIAYSDSDRPVSFEIVEQ